MVIGNITHQLPWLHVRAEAEEKFGVKHVIQQSTTW